MDPLAPPPGDDAEERRAHPRATVEIPAWVAADGARIHTVTQDLSIGGVRMRAVTEWPSNEKVEVALALGGERPTLSLQGRVVWRFGDWIGVTFVNVTSEAERALQQQVNIALGLETGTPADAADFDDGSGTVEVGSLKS